MNYKTKLAGIKALAFDVDGVLTDGTVHILPGQEPVRTFHSKDGYALQVAARQGLQLAIITGGKSETVKERLKALGVQDVWLGARHKIEAYEEWLARYGLRDDEVLYMGDDLPDTEVLQRAGLSCCPHDSAPEIRALVDYVSPIDGGKGCVREVIEQVLRAQGRWNLEEFRNW
ncbi:MAG: 3-deoxy-D-manno-octulosonate 8-phosphate phosphatase KdsC [Bacteroidota bacterium]|jgi:3-deoxy-D-manno-octulosonate 8-phosphate phosphatase (KDO 8-P phosphatase)